MERYGLKDGCYHVSATYVDKKQDIETNSDTINFVALSKSPDTVCDNKQISKDVDSKPVKDKNQS